MDGEDESDSKAETPAICESPVKLETKFLKVSPNKSITKLSAQRSRSKSFERKSRKRVRTFLLDCSSQEGGDSASVNPVGSVGVSRAAGQNNPNHTMDPKEAEMIEDCIDALTIFDESKRE